jgi:4'-phosphopantetheinyl transferase
VIGHPDPLDAGQNRTRALKLGMEQHSDAAREEIDCKVWLADTEAGAGPALLNMLDPIELRRRESYLRPADRVRFTLAAALLRLVAAVESGLSPDRIRVERTCPVCQEPHGRPRLPETGLHFSVSHSGGKVAVASSRTAPVGVDIEAVAGQEMATEAAAVCLTPGEPLTYPESFFTYWCRKESVVKATGEGLTVPLTDVVVTPADKPAALRRYCGALLPATISDLDVGPGYAGAVTVLAAGTMKVQLTDAGPLLANYG